jgi:hypothetical protein
MWCIGQNLFIFWTSYEIIHWKIHLHVKVIFWEKNLQSFSKVIFLASNYMLKPKIIFSCSSLSFGCGFNYFKLVLWSNSYFIFFKISTNSSLTLQIEILLTPIFLILHMKTFWGFWYHQKMQVTNHTLTNTTWMETKEMGNVYPPFTCRKP